MMVLHKVNALTRARIDKSVGVLICVDYAAFVEPNPPCENLPLIASPGAQVVQPYWVHLASSLTRLHLNHKVGMGRATIHALNKLTNLNFLTLTGVKSQQYPQALMALALPKLQTLGMGGFSRVRIFLRCPQLRLLTLVGMHPSEALQGIQDVKRICLKDLGEGSLSLERVLQGQRLKRLNVLGLWLRPETYRDPGALAAIKGVLRHCRLQILFTDCPLEKLTPLQGSQCALPFTLKNLQLHLPLEKGLPMVLEQLTRLKTLEITDTGEERMHLDRPLDPFLDMAKLTLLTFQCKTQEVEEAAKSPKLTSKARKFLRLAAKRIAKDRLKPCGRHLVLKY